MRYVIAVLGLVALLAALVGLKVVQIKTLMGFGEEMAKAGPPPESVSTATAKEEVWQANLNTVASVVSGKGVGVSNDSPGVVARIHFESGAKVKQGQVLVELDTSVERAQLRSTQARRELAELSAKRSRTLATSGVVAQSQVDADESSFKSLSAEVSALSAQIERKIIRAPFSGRLGIRAVNLGQYLPPGTVITTLESTDSVFIDFTLPQQNLPQLKVGMVVRASEEGSSDKGVQGTISAIDPAVDAQTRNVKVRATFPNLDDQLRPGMFVRVKVELPEESRVVIVPQISVLHASYGDSVFLVEEKPGAQGKPPAKVARQQFVRLGEARGDFVAVVEGLKAGQEVVTSGAFKLRNGIPLVIDNKTVKLDPKLAPTPVNR
jgi:membrane fusion protein (multidrug efflux system)